MPRNLPPNQRTTAAKLKAVKLKLEEAKLAKVESTLPSAEEAEPTTFMNMVPPNDEEIAYMRAELIRRYDRLAKEQAQMNKEELLRWVGFAP